MSDVYHEINRHRRLNYLFVGLFTVSYFEYPLYRKCDDKLIMPLISNVKDYVYGVVIGWSCFSVKFVL